MDRYAAERRWQATLELRDFTWVLVDVQIRSITAQPDAAPTVALPFTR